MKWWPAGGIAALLIRSFSSPEAGMTNGPRRVIVALLLLTRRLSGYSATPTQRLR